MTIEEITQDPAVRIAIIITIYILIGFLFFAFIWVGYRILRPMFKKTNGDDMKEYMREIAKAGKAIKPKEATWSQVSISKDNATISFGKGEKSITVAEKESKESKGLKIASSTADPRSKTE